MEEESISSSWRNHGGGIMEEESWRRNHGGGIMEEEESWWRNHGGGIMEEESWRNHGGGINKKTCLLVQQEDTPWHIHIYIHIYP